MNFLADLSATSAERVCREIEQARQPNDIVIVSLHWGPNWGYDIPDEQRRFSHDLIDRGGASVVHGHSSHHAKAIEFYRSRLVLYGCGDFLNDYEGIKGYEEYRGDLALMYFADVDPVSGDLTAAELVPLQIKRFQLVAASAEDVAWILQTLDRESRPFGTRITQAPAGRLALSWAGAGLPGSASEASTR